MTLHEQLAGLTAFLFLIAAALCLILGGWQLRASCLEAGDHQVLVIGQTTDEAVKGAAAGQSVRLIEPADGPECGVVLHRLANASFQVVIEGASYREKLSLQRKLLGDKGSG